MRSIWQSHALIGLSSNMEEAVLEEAGGLLKWKYCSQHRGVKLFIIL
jgi:hypothetical protein